MKRKCGSCVFLSIPHSATVLATIPAIVYYMQGYAYRIIALDALCGHDVQHYQIYQRVLLLQFGKRSKLHICHDCFTHGDIKQKV